ncbi:MAG: uncharacterized protein A8A55_0163 [Amphiamblys sp. WSBS2006]|nr:MAG: uncharacterized protein A8A55_0175 [Amphiamblys sp. WSBS2006]OIR59047.1 MAG: uncharacterized protein A8A55_0163 [Amphiamblys sp. WSBS2006]
MNFGTFSGKKFEEYMANTDLLKTMTGGEKDESDIPPEKRTKDTQARIDIHISNKKIHGLYKKIDKIEETLLETAYAQEQRGENIIELQELMHDLQTGALLFKKKTKSSYMALIKENMKKYLWLVILGTVFVLFVVFAFVHEFKTAPSKDSHK